jgi:hypothetical protein
MLQYVPGVPNSYQITQNVAKRFVVKVPVIDVESKHEPKILTVDSMPVPIDFTVGRYYDDGQLIVDPRKWSTLLPPVDDETAFAAVAPTRTFEDVFQRSKRARTSL